MEIYNSLFIAKNVLFTGLLNTLFAALISISVGSCIGAVLGFILVFGHKAIKFPIRLLVDLIRGIPGLVTIFSVFYMIDFLLRAWGIYASTLSIGALALAIPCSMQMADICRGGFQNIDKSQIEAGKSIGMQFYQIFFSILFPQALVQIIPPWINVATEMVKATTLLMLIGVSELLLVTQQLVARNGNALLYYVFIGIIYFTINTVLEFAGKKMEVKLSLYKKR